jgi:hypothetical protein
MKIFKTYRITAQIIMLFFAVSITSCVVHTGTTKTVKTKQVPPGQAKKMTGQKSAKNYAPGHNK